MYCCVKFRCTATAKLLQSCPTLCNPTDSGPPSSPFPGILQARTLEWVPLSGTHCTHCQVYSKVISYTHTYFFSDYFPICVTIQYWVDFLVLYRRSLFTIYFYIVVCVGYSHLLVYLSLPLPTFVAITLSLFCKWVHLYHFLDSTWNWYHMIFVFDFTYYDNLYVHPCC